MESDDNYKKFFAPMTSQLGVPGTSFRLQLGLINEKWTVRVLKGRDIIDSYVFKDEDVESEFPNQNLIVGWVLRTVAIPNINPHQVMKTTQALVKQAIQIKEQRKNDEDGFVPYPYIFKPPTPPGDLGLAGEAQAKLPVTDEKPEYEPYCKHCGAKLSEGETICHVCGKKTI